MIHWTRLFEMTHILLIKIYKKHVNIILKFLSLKLIFNMYLIFFFFNSGVTICEVGYVDSLIVSLFFDAQWVLIFFLHIPEKTPSRPSIFMFGGNQKRLENESYAIYWIISNFVDLSLLEHHFFQWENNIGFHSTMVDAASKTKGFST